MAKKKKKTTKKKTKPIRSASAKDFNERRVVFASLRKKVAPVKKTSLRKRTKEYLERIKIRNLPINMIANIDSLVENHI